MTVDPSPIRVLLVEDDEDDYRLTRALLAEIESRKFQLDWVTTYDGGLEAIGRGEHDVYLLDYRLGARHGLELLRTAIERGCQAPLILITGEGDEQIDLEAMKAGAADYLIKGRIDAPLLDRSIRYSLERNLREDALARPGKSWKIGCRNAPRSCRPPTAGWLRAIVARMSFWPCWPTSCAASGTNPQRGRADAARGPMTPTCAGPATSSNDKSST